METFLQILSGLAPFLFLVLMMFGIPFLRNLAKKYQSETIEKFADWAVTYTEQCMKNKDSQEKFKTAMDQLEKMCKEKGIPFDTTIAKTLIEKAVFDKNTNGTFPPSIGKTE